METEVEKIDESALLQRCIRGVLKQDLFGGSLIQEMNFLTRVDVPTAALSYDKKRMKFTIYLGKEFFFKKLNDTQRVAVMIHELLHFSRGHIFREMFAKESYKHDVANIAMDMAINQYIQNLPEGCVEITKWKMKDGSPFPEFKTWELYYQLIEDTTKDPKPESGDTDKSGDPSNQPGSGDPSNQPGRGKSRAEGGKGNPDGSDINWDEMEKYRKKPFDAHSWDDLTEEEKRQMLEEAGKIVRRAIDNSTKDYSNVPGAVKDLLLEIDTQLRGMNVKAIFRQAVKKHLPSPDRTSTWFKPNKRYGVLAPGSTTDKLPAISAYVDTSGSFSHTEINGAFKMLNTILGEGQMQKCSVGLWHTELYSFKKYKKGKPILADDIESGGTNPECVLEHINKTNPNIAIVFTDGYYSPTSMKVTSPVVFVISKNGNADHPYKHLGLTFKMEHLT